MKKLIVLWCLLLTIGNAAFAQSFPKPPDVPAYVTVTPTYQSGTTLNSVNTSPSYANEGTDVPTSQTGWVTTVTVSNTSGSYCSISGACPENKLRFHANFSHFSPDDPVRNYGQPGTSHLHMFFGNRRANSYSTFATLRAHPDSTSEGGRLNGSAYWAPAFILTNPFGDGKNYALPPDWIVFYYNGGDGAHSSEFSRFPLGLRNVFGNSMDDPENSIEKAEIATANAQPGTSGRYSWQSNGFLGYRCEADTTTTYIDHLKNANGSDPFANVGSLGPGGCPAGNHIIAVINGPQFWDCQNPWSPGGYKHFRQGVMDNVKGDLTGPNAWCRLPTITLQVAYMAQGPSDYTRWRLSSDDAMQTKENALPACTGSNTPCMQVAGGHTVLNGQSFHADYMIGWDKTTLIEAFTNCIGTNGGTPHECGDSLISAVGTTGKALLSGGPAPDGRNPQIDTLNKYDTTSASKMWQIPASYTGMTTMHNHM